MGVAHLIIQQSKIEQEKLAKRRKWLKLPASERQRISSRLYRERNIDQRRAATKDWFTKNPDYNKNYIRNKAIQNPSKYLWKLCQRRALDKNMEFNIEISDVIVPSVCPVLNIKLQLEIGRGRNGDSASIDRIDNSKGYVKGNIQVISMRANWIKGDATIEEMEKVLQYMRDKIL